MFPSWVVPGAAAAFFTSWTYHSGKFIGLPKLSHKYGIPLAVGSVILAAYMFKKSHEGHHGIIGLPPHIHPRTESYYAQDPNPVGVLPLGAYTGPGLEQKNVPESSVVDFPDFTARKQLHGLWLE